MKIEFLDIEFFYLIGLLLALLIGKKSFQNYKNHFSQEMFGKIFINNIEKKYSYIFLVLSFLAVVVALARPVLYDDIEVQKTQKSFMVGLDLSLSMDSKDIYPSRLKFAKNRFLSLLEELDDEKVGVLGFSSETFLIAPVTADYESLKYSINNLNTDTINKKGSDIFSILKYLNIFLKNTEQKVLLLYTDGTEQQNFEKSINYAKEHNIKIFVYAVATKKGSVIEDKKKLLKDKDGNIVITSLNQNIKTLCEQTGGEYFEYSTQTKDSQEIKRGIDKILTKNKNNKERLEQQKELFYIPLILAMLFFLLGTTGLYKRRLS